jgi:nucleoside phosphorylase
MASVKRLHHGAYTVGWICALHVEMAAAKAMLDERHQNLPQPPRDNNNYVLGEIFGHNVVIACLPSGEYGTNSAATVSTQMLSTFPQIQFNLMVGISGGAPGTVDIRLGHVVVSNPTGKYGGVVQYDLGKTVGDGCSIHTGTLNRPPQRLLTAVGNLRSECMMGTTRVPEFLLEMEKKCPAISDFQYPKSAVDNLFRADYDHPDPEQSCDSCCDKRMVVFRQPRLSQIPKIHYGLIASGNQVMKHAASSDRIAKEHGVICFEMEAAGLMNHFPCLVIRGICDYADSHKTKEWQKYAAATAAAYTKELLAVIQASETVAGAMVQFGHIPGIYSL